MMNIVVLLLSRMMLIVPTGMPMDPWSNHDHDDDGWVHCVTLLSTAQSSFIAVGVVVRLRPARWPLPGMRVGRILMTRGIFFEYVVKPQRTRPRLKYPCPPPFQTVGDIYPNDFVLIVVKREFFREKFCQIVLIRSSPHQSRGEYARLWHSFASSSENPETANIPKNPETKTKQETNRKKWE